MSNNALRRQIDYHAARAIEEQDRAELTKKEAERSSHLELSRLHLEQAAQLRAIKPIASPVTPRIKAALDMGEASREQGFRQFGCR